MQVITQTFKRNSSFLLLFLRTSAAIETRTVQCNQPDSGYRVQIQMQQRMQFINPVSKICKIRKFAYTDLPSNCICLFLHSFIHLKTRKKLFGRKNGALGKGKLKFHRRARL